MDATGERYNLVLSTHVGRDVDEACDRFEAAWREGDRPLIEDFLGTTAPSDRLVLLRNLLDLELIYRSSLGELPEPLEYRHRFPGNESLIDSIFAELVLQPVAGRVRGEETLPSTGWQGVRSGPPTSSPPELLPGLPGVEILTELGRGGMGVVYKARQVQLNRLCAVKITLPGERSSAVFRTRFLAEAEAIARLRHPNIVQIYGLGEHDGRPYFEMEYVEGGSLAARLDGTPWAPGRAARMVALLARAIGEAHRSGIVHRDLKPANILLVDEDTPKVVDFGLAKTLESDSNLTQSGVFLGTPSYAAPEQVEGLNKGVGPAADIYALGAIFYHMLTGRPPFHAASVHQTLEQVKSAEPVAPSRLQPGLSRDAETICLKCLEKEPQGRYADAEALAEDLDRYLAGRAILARPTGTIERFEKWVMRRPAIALLSASVAGVALLGFVLVAWQWRRAEAKAVAAAAANEQAQQARLLAFEKQAQLTFHQGLDLCDQGEVGRGLLWLGRSLELSAEAQSDDLDRPIRINLADWANQLSRPLPLPAVPNSGPLAARGEVAARRIREPESDFDAPALAIAKTPDGRKVIKGKRGGRLHIWDEKAERAFDLPAQGSEVTCLAVSTDGRVFASGTSGGIIRLWDTCLLGQIGQTHKLEGAATALAFASDGRTLLIKGDDGTNQLREVPHPKALGFPIRFSSPVQSLTFKADGRRLLIGTAQGARWWDLSAGMVCKTEQSRDDRLNREPAGRVEATAVSPDSRTVATARSLVSEGRPRGRLELSDAATVNLLRRTPDLPHALSGVVFSPDSKWVLAWGSEPGTAGLWDAATLRESRQVFRSLKSAVRRAGFSGDGRTLLLGCRDGKGRLWDLETDTEIDPERGPRHAYPITAVAFDPVRSRLVTGCHAGTVRVWDAARGRIVNELRQNAGEIGVLSFSPDGKMLVTASDDGTARFLDAETGAQLGPALRHTDAVLCVAFAPDGQSIATGTRDGVVQRWSVPAAPKSGGVAEILRWVKAQTGMELDDQGAVTIATVGH